MALAGLVPLFATVQLANGVCMGSAAGWGWPGEGGRVCAHMCVHLCANTAERTGQAKAAGPLCLIVQPEPPGAWDIWDRKARVLPTQDPKEP